MSPRVCPRCPLPTSIVEAGGVVGEDVCRSCHGRFLAPELTERIVVEELGVERATLHEIAAMFSGLRLACPGCRAAMRPLRLRGVVVDLCFSCGGLWLDAGELARLTGGRHVEVVDAAPATAAADAPVVVGELAGVLPGRDEGFARSVALGRGHAAVVLESLGAPDVARLRAAFARTDGLTTIDADQLGRHTNGVVVEGVSPAGAVGLVEELARVGVRAAVVGEAVLRLPAALAVVGIDVVHDASHGPGLLRARFSVGPPLVVGLETVRAAVLGALSTGHGAPAAGAPSVDVLVGARLDARRLSWSAVGGDVDAVIEVARRLWAAGVPLPRADAAGPWTIWPTPRDRDRELAWAAWRGGR